MSHESNPPSHRQTIEKFELPHQSPVQPVQLGLDDTIQFNCHKGIACFNACCKNIDITLTPYDVVRLSRRLGIATNEFLLKYSMHYDLDAHGMPGIKMRPRDDSPACQFVTDEGCSVYEDRPTACRYYAMGTMQLRRKDSTQLEDVYFMVKEEHCLGHNEPRKLTVREYRKEQGVEKYDDMNRDWLDIIVKKRSSGPTVGAPSARSFQLFALASYDLDAFREFVQSTSFQQMFDLAPDYSATLARDDEELLRFAARFIKQVMFGERSIPLREGAATQRYEQRRELIERKHREDIERYRLRDPQEGGEDA